ncbi:MAG: sigma-E processing peptidase SpoIIGA [Evtepia sp.]
MTTVYLDARFALDLAVNYCLLACAARLDGGAVRRRRLALAAGLGAGYGVLTLLPGLGALGHPVGAALAAAGMLLAAYGPVGPAAAAGGAVSGAVLRLWGRAGFGVR